MPIAAEGPFSGLRIGLRPLTTQRRTGGSGAPNPRSGCRPLLQGPSTLAYPSSVHSVCLFGFGSGVLVRLRSLGRRLRSFCPRGFPRQRQWGGVGIGCAGCQPRAGGEHSVVASSSESSADALHATRVGTEARARRGKPAGSHCRLARTRRMRKPSASWRAIPSPPSGTKHELGLGRRARFIHV